MTEAAGRSGRPARRQLKRPGAVRTVRHVVKVNEDQELRLQARADERGITVARLLVESALAGGADAAAAKAAMHAELFRVVRMLGAVGNNVNQIARQANSTGEVPAAAAHALDAHTRTVGRLQQFLDDVESGR